MAYTNSPEKETYSSARIPLTQSIFNDRPAETPLSMKNVLPFKQAKAGSEEEVYCETRAGITGFNVSGTTNGGVCRGIYVWEKTVSNIYYFCVVGTGVYTSVNLFSWTLVNTLLTSATTPVRFTEFISSTNTKSLVLVDGVEGYVYTSNAAGTKITDVDFPTPHVPFPVFLNGRVYLAKKETGDIYNSALDDPASWAAGDFISSEVYPDDVQALVKINNYILAIGSSGCEYFADTANSTGSPIARQEGASLPVGTNYPNSIAYTFDTVCFLSKGRDGEYCLRAIEGFKHQEIPAPFLLQEISSVVVSPTTAAALRAYFFRQKGKLFFAFARDGSLDNASVANTYFTYVYSFDTGMWVEFTRGNHASERTLYGDSAHKAFPVYFTASGNTSSPTTFVGGQAGAGGFFGYFGTDSNGYDYIPITAAAQTNIWYVSSVATDRQDFRTMNVKTMSRLALDYTQRYDNSTLYTDTMVPRVSWTDTPPTLNGYTTPRKLEGAYYQNYGSTTTGLDSPYITQLGAFRRRWFLVECYGSVKYNYLEVDINKGQQ
jgi:hypothetical protein